MAFSLHLCARLLVARWLVACGLAIAMGLALAGAAPAEDLKETTSLKFVPADAAFYSVRLRMKEQIGAIAGSKAWARLLELPGIKDYLEKARAIMQSPPDSPFPSEWAQLELPENKQLIGLVLDGFSHEFFIYGDAGYGETLGAINQTGIAVNTTELEAKKTGQREEDIFAKRLAELMDKDAGKLRLPHTVIGFKLTDLTRTEAQIARLEKLANAELDKHAQWKGRLIREKIGGSEFLTLKLDGSLLPWDQIPPPDDAESKAAMDKVIEKLKSRTLTISLGIREGYLLLSIGETTEQLARLGQGKLLIDQPELAPLVKHADRPLTSISYISQQFLEKSNSTDLQIDNYVSMAEQALPLSGLDADLQKELIADARSLAADLKKYIPKPGARMSFGFMSARGLEGFSYDWGEQLGIDGSKPLTILDHVGGDPLGFAAARGKFAPQDYELLVKWLGRGLYYGEQIGLPQLDEEVREQYSRARAEFTPLLARLDQVTRDLWIPAFADGQGAVVLDAKLAHKQWHAAMPEAARPLPMLEIGMVYGVSDAAKVKRAAGEYFLIAADAMKALHKIAPEQIPEVELTMPLWREFPEGTVYFYNLPRELGLDTQVAPNAGLSSSFLALSLLPKVSLRLLKPTPPALDGPLARRGKPLASAAYLNWAGLLEAAAPWIDYGLNQSTEIPTGAGPEAAGDTAAMRAALQGVKDHVHAVLAFLQCLRTMSSVSYFEEGALVTHSEWRLEDQK
ncbi:MAG: hypothetical protein L0211_15950 [Planctomycetaceae bacterium]|nr:hypothetical protein [Planctomycetaceae bacterium]